MNILKTVHLKMMFTSWVINLKSNWKWKNIQYFLNIIKFNHSLIHFCLLTCIFYDLQSTTCPYRFFSVGYLLWSNIQSIYFIVGHYRVTWSSSDKKKKTHLFVRVNEIIKIGIIAWFMHLFNFLVIV